MRDIAVLEGLEVTPGEVSAIVIRFRWRSGTRWCPAGISAGVVLRRYLLDAMAGQGSRT